MQVDRRQFTTCLTSTALLGALSRKSQANLNGAQPVFIATWKFGLPACQKSLATLGQTNSMLDAIEQGIRVTEADTQVNSVGVGGAPNASGIVQLDACIMDGETHQAGSVAALEGYPHPISVARRVMEKTKHVLLVGAGAAEFANDQGFSKLELLTDKQKTKWENWSAEQANAKSLQIQNAGPDNHDTIALLGVDATGHLAGGCSTSGVAYKLPGRVGDSPILGSGLYVNGEIGAAGATGLGENVMRHCGSFLIVELMRSGMNPEMACRKTIERIAKIEKIEPAKLHVNFLAINKAGQWGAAGTDAGYQVAVVTRQSAGIAKPFLVTS